MFDATELNKANQAVEQKFKILFMMMTIILIVPVVIIIGLLLNHGWAVTEEKH